MSDSEKASKEKADKYEKAIRQMEKHVEKKSDGTRELKIKDGKDIGVEPEVFEDLRRSLEEFNKKVKSGEIRPDQVREAPGG